MAFTVPDFNLSFNVWIPGQTPSGFVASFFAVPGQLYVPPKAFADVVPATTANYEPSVYIRVDAATRNTMGNLVGSIWGFTDASMLTWYFMVRFWTHVHAGFPNEYIMMQVDQCTSAGASPDTTR